MERGEDTGSGLPPRPFLISMHVTRCQMPDFRLSERCESRHAELLTGTHSVFSFMILIFVSHLLFLFIIRARSQRF